MKRTQPVINMSAGRYWIGDSIFLLPENVDITVEKPYVIGSKKIAWTEAEGPMIPEIPPELRGKNLDELGAKEIKFSFYECSGIMAVVPEELFVRQKTLEVVRRMNYIYEGMHEEDSEQLREQDKKLIAERGEWCKPEQYSCKLVEFEQDFQTRVSEDQRRWLVGDIEMALCCSYIRGVVTLKGMEVLSAPHIPIAQEEIEYRKKQLIEMYNWKV